MIDLHCHILPQFDDGADSWETAVEMCRVSAADGIRHIVATPHASERYAYNRRQGELALRRLQVLCPEVQLHLGCDFHFSSRNIDDAVQHPRRYTLGASNFLLVELNNFSQMLAIQEGLFRLASVGLTPIITHPERNAALLQRPAKLLELISHGCLVQVTANSFTGYWGARSQHMAESLLKQDAIHVVASDAHDPLRRPPLLSPAYERIRKLSNDGVARALFFDNPKTILFGAAVSSEMSA